MTRDKLKRRIQKREILQYGIDIISLIKQRTILRLLDKINGYNVVIMSLSKSRNRPCLTYLTRPFDDKRFMPIPVFPLQ